MPRGTPCPTAPKAVAAVENYLAKLGAGDLEGIAAAYAAEPTVHDPIGSEPKAGRGEPVEAFYASILPFTPKTTVLGPDHRHRPLRGLPVSRMDLTIGDNPVVVYAYRTVRHSTRIALITEMTAVPDLEAAG
ncbi:hypothetical protein ACU686_29435 [Yinghuangia aomiensis]